MIKELLDLLFFSFINLAHDRLGKCEMGVEKKTSNSEDFWKTETFEESFGMACISSYINDLSK